MVVKADNSIQQTLTNPYHQHSKQMISQVRSLGLILIIFLEEMIEKISVKLTKLRISKELKLGHFERVCNQLEKLIPYNLITNFQERKRSMEGISKSPIF
jgi:hypothetical protein